jgi:hypothetical protein
MKEFQFKINKGFWLDVHAESEQEAVDLLNSQLHFLNEPLPAPGRIQRVQLDTIDSVTVEDIASTFDFKE